MAYLSLQQYIEDSENSELIRVLKEREKNERAESSWITTINRGVSVPEDLIIDILSRLPVKTLLQFKSVSKLWHTIIVSPRFVSKHIENYYNNNHDTDCFLTLTAIPQDGEVLYGIFVDKTRRIHKSRLDVTLRDFEIYGPCNGVYYLGSYTRDAKRLWNPAINDLKVLPPIIVKPDLLVGLTRRRYGEAFGFGYDPFTNDYKVVAIEGYYAGINDNIPPLSILVVYSLTTDSWNYWGDCYYRVEDNNSNIFVNECLYWVGERLDDEFGVIISFNIVSNVLQEIQLPNYDKQSHTSLGILEDAIAFYTVHNAAAEYEDTRCFVIWTFNDGVWTKRITIPIAGDFRPMGHLKNGMVVLHCDSDLVLFDPNTNNSWNIAKRIDWDGFQSIVVYMESLVSVNGSSTQH